MTTVVLVLQEGPGAGRTYPLDPLHKTTVSVGRSESSDVVLGDNRSSRHHANVQWTGRDWEVVDQGSTNGTYVNGLRIDHPYALRVGDRVTVGDTTLVLRSVPTEGEAAPGAQPSGRAAAAGESSPVLFWAAQAALTLAAVCLAAGSLLPWLDIRGQVREDVAPLLQQGFQILGALTGTDPSQMVSYTIDGMMAYGKLTFALAVLTTAALVIEIFFYRKSLIPGVVVLVTGLIGMATMGFEAVNLGQHAIALQGTEIFFGYQLGDLTNVLGDILEVEVVPQSGIWLVGAGLVLLLVGAVVRVLSGVLGGTRAARRG